jgi:hypothetical protein
LLLRPLGRLLLGLAAAPRLKERRHGLSIGARGSVLSTLFEWTPQSCGAGWRNSSAGTS